MSALPGARFAHLSVCLSLSVCVCVCVCVFAVSKQRVIRPVTLMTELLLSASV